MERYIYNAEKLLDYKQSKYQLSVDIKFLIDLKLGLFHKKKNGIFNSKRTRRGRRAGRCIRQKQERNQESTIKTIPQFAQRNTIPVVITSRPPLQKTPNPRGSTFTNLRKISTHPVSCPSSNNNPHPQFLATPTFYLVNATSIAKENAKQHLQTDLTFYNADFGIIIESWLKKHHSDQLYAIDGYNLIRRDRPGRRGGGIAVYCSKNYQIEIIQVPNDCDAYEVLWIRTKHNNKTFILGALYHPPKPIYQTKTFIKFIQDTIDFLVTNATNEVPTIILAGDFNSMPNEAIIDSGLFLVTREPTHRNNYLDRIYTNENVFSHVKVIKSTIFTAHKAVIASSQVTQPLDKNKTREIISYRRRSAPQQASLLTSLQQTSWESVINTRDTQTATDNFYRIVYELLDLHFPSTQVTLTSRDPKYVTPEIKKLLQKKNKLMKKGHLEQAEAITLRVGKMICENNKKSLSKIETKSSKQLWKAVKESTESNRKPQIITNGFTCSQLNSHFAAISTDKNYVKPPFKSTCNVADECSFADEYCIFNSLIKLKPTASGPDGIPYWFLKAAAPAISLPLSHIFKLSLDNSFVPIQWKEAVIRPIPKTKNPEVCDDFRPISITPILSRTLQKNVVKCYIYPMFYEPSISSKFTDQYAFRPSGSTEAAIISIIQHVTSLLLTNDYVRVISLDFSKAFDTIRHSKISDKLSDLPLPDNVYNWFINFLNDHSHKTVFNGFLSESASINASVFQGSAVGPSFYVISSSDLKPVHSNNYLDKYADDSYLIVGSNHDDTILAEIENVENWASCNNLSLNKSKSKEIIFSRQANINPYSIQGIARSSEINILGITFSSHLRITQHVNNVIEASMKLFYGLRLLQNRGLCKKGLIQVFKATILSKITYAGPSWWGYATAEEKNRLESLLRKAVKWGYYSPEDKSLEKIFDEKDEKLFQNVLNQETHVLRCLLPPQKENKYKLRAKTHGRCLPEKHNKVFNSNFIVRLAYKNSY